ncbi:MAG TPA: diacylglycerol kinase family protein [Methylomirabilota bacterium]|nr:diacylglycerol kinase family protein [Methylomirabilota bacterium]
MTRAVVVVNPAAGGGRTARVWRRLCDVMAATLPAEHVETRASGDGERLAREAALAGAPLVVAVGGDGTLNEVVNGVRGAGTETVVGAVLTGRGCDASRNFGVPRDPVAAVRALADGHDARFDLGRAEWADGRRRWFVTSAGAGFDAAVARRAQSVRVRGTLPYLATVIASVHLHRPTPATLELDGVARPAAPITAVVAANGRWFGGGMKIAPDADPADGAFDVVILGDLGRLELLRWLPSVYPGTHLRNPRITVQRARRLTVTAPTPLPTHVDGEPVGVTPVTLTLEPGAFRLRVPRGA